MYPITKLCSPQVYPTNTNATPTMEKQTCPAGPAMQIVAASRPDDCLFLWEPHISNGRRRMLMIRGGLYRSHTKNVVILPHLKISVFFLDWLLRMGALTEFWISIALGTPVGHWEQLPPAPSARHGSAAASAGGTEIPGWSVKRFWFRLPMASPTPN